MQAYKIALYLFLFNYALCFFSGTQFFGRIDQIRCDADAINIVRIIQRNIFAFIQRKQNRAASFI